MAKTFLSNANATLLPPTITGPIFNLTTEQSAVQQLARKVPLSIDANTVIPVSMDIPVAGWVTEGQKKPVAQQSVGIRQMSGKKLALILPVSEELTRSNPAGLYDQLKQDLPAALSRAFDYAAIHGKDLRTGAAGPFGENYLRSTQNVIDLGATSAANGGIYIDLVSGEELVVNSDFDFSGFVGDPRLRVRVKKAVDTTGQPIWSSDPHGGVNTSSLIGYPAAYNRGVSGKYTRFGNRVQVITLTGTPTGGTFMVFGNGNSVSFNFNESQATAQTKIQTLGGPFASATVAGTGPWTVTLYAAPTATGVAGSAAPLGATSNIAGANTLTGGSSPAVNVTQSPAQDTLVRAVGGDWSQCAWGQGIDITVKVSDEASYVDDDGTTVHSAFQENLVLLLVEAYYGFVVGNPNAFVIYND